MHFTDDPISDMHAKKYLIISCLKHFPGPTKFGPVFSGAVPSNTTTLICDYRFCQFPRSAGILYTYFNNQ